MILETTTTSTTRLAEYRGVHAAEEGGLYELRGPSQTHTGEKPEKLPARGCGTQRSECTSCFVFWKHVNGLHV